jgi:hypothetical protein
MDGAPVPITGEEEVVSLGLARRMRPMDGRCAVAHTGYARCGSCLIARGRR